MLMIPSRCQLQVRHCNLPYPPRPGRPILTELPRHFTVKQAKSIGVTGYVTNASDGTVRFP